jgi:hypothetical protein
MKPISSPLDAHLQQEVTTLATCWKITRTEDEIKAFTTLDIDLVFDGITYLSIVGISPSSLETKDDMSVQNIDLAGVTSEDYISVTDIMAGLYDFAEVEIFKVNYTDLTQGRILEQRGTIGEIKLQKQMFVVELRGLAQQLQQHIGDLFSATCRAELGDSKCQKNLTAFTFTTSVTTVTSNLVFIANALTQAAGYFTSGTITWTSGNNIGLSQDIKEFATKQVVMAEPMPFSIQAGDTFSIVAGCDKIFDTCKTKFNNVINFRGEPHVPGLDAIMKTAGTL